MTIRRPLPNSILTALSTTQIKLSGTIAQELSEQTRDAYHVGWETGWHAGWEARDALPPVEQEPPVLPPERHSTPLNPTEHPKTPETPQ